MQNKIYEKISHLKRTIFLIGGLLLTVSLSSGQTVNTSYSSPNQKIVPVPKKPTWITMHFGKVSNRSNIFLKPQGNGTLQIHRMVLSNQKETVYDSQYNLAPFKLQNGALFKIPFDSNLLITHVQILAEALSTPASINIKAEFSNAGHGHNYDHSEHGPQYFFSCGINEMVVTSVGKQSLVHTFNVPIESSLSLDYCNEVSAKLTEKIKNQYKSNSIVAVCANEMMHRFTLTAGQFTKIPAVKTTDSANCIAQTQNFNQFEVPLRNYNFMPLKSTQDYVAILKARPLEPIDPNAKYLYLYGVSVNRITRVLDGEILNQEKFKSQIMAGINLSSYTCDSTSTSCTAAVQDENINCYGRNSYTGYRGGLVVWFNSCGAEHMYLKMY